MQKADTATGGKLSLRNIEFHLFSLSADLDGVVFHGSEGEEKPLLSVQELKISLNVNSLWRHKFILNELVIEHPVVHLAVDNSGKSNLPHPPSSGYEGSGTSSGLSVDIIHLLLENGDIYCNDTKNRIEASARNVQANVHYDFTTFKYAGSLSYNQGELHYANLESFPHGMNVHFTADSSSFSAHPLVFNVARSKLTLNAKIVNFHQPTLTGHYDILLHAGDFAGLSPNVKSAGVVKIAGEMRYRNPTALPFLQAIQADGTIRSDELSVAMAKAQLQVRNLASDYRLVHGRLQARKVSAHLLDGSLSAQLLIELGAVPHAQIYAQLARISVGALRHAVHQPRLKTLPLTGEVRGNLQAAWTGSVRNMELSSQIKIHGAAWSQTGGQSGAVPVKGAIQLAYEGSQGLLRIQNCSIQAAAATFNLQGQISRRSNLSIHVTTSNLSQTAQLASLSNSSGVKSDVAKAGISGSAALNVVMHGSLSHPQFTGELHAQHLQTYGSRWKQAVLAFQAGPSEIGIQPAHLTSFHQGNVTLNAQVGLRHWSFAASNPITGHLDVHHMEIADLRHLAGLKYPVSGEINGTADFSGSELHPAGNGSIQISKAAFYGESVQKVTAKFQAGNGKIQSRFQASLAAGDLNADLTYTPSAGSYSLQFEAPEIDLAKLQIVQKKNWQLTGNLSARGGGQGTLAKPQLTASVRVPQLRFRRTQISGVDLQVNVDPQEAKFTLASEINSSPVDAQGQVGLRDPHQAQFKIDTGLMPLNPLLAGYITGLPQDFQSDVELHATLRGPIDDRTRMQAHVTIPTFKASYRNLNLQSQAPIQADLEHGVFTLPPLELSGTDTSLQVGGTIPISGSQAINVTAKGSLDVGILRMVRPDITSSGRIALDLKAAGSTRSASVSGQVHLRDVALSSMSWPAGIEKLNGNLDLNDHVLQIRSLAGQVGGGAVTVGGSITFRPQLQFNLALQGKSMRVRYPQGVRTILESNLTFVGNTQASTLAGQVLIGNLSFTPDFDLTQFLNQFNEVSAPPPSGSFTNRVKLHIDLQSTQNLRATSQQLNLSGTASLQVIGTLASPVVIGRADLNSGELFFRNNRYTLQRGLITLNDPFRTRPTVDIVAKTTIEQYNLTLTLRGSINRLNTSYMSDPPLATADVINLVARGQTTGQSGASPMSADSILAGQVAGQVTSGIQKLAGLSSLQIDPLIGGDNQNPSARVALQQRVTRNLLFTFSTDVTQPGSEVVQGDYRINRKWSVSVARNQQGGVSIDGRYHTRF